MNSLMYEGARISMVNRHNWVAVIGSRKASQLELEQTYHFSRRLARAGKIVVSGLAAGIDTAAHQGALDEGGQTIAILNTPKSQPLYPKENRNLGEYIKRQGGIIYPFDTPAMESKDKGMSHFQKRLLERDILLSYLTPVITAVKHDDKPINGGTRWAINYGKEFRKRVVRLDGNGKVYENPQAVKAQVYWDMELNFHEFVKRLETELS